MKKLFFSFVLVLVSISLFPSNDKPGKGFSINATVIDKQSGEAIVGAKVELLGTDKPYYSDLDGHLVFQTTSRANEEIVISAVGYETTHIKLSEVALSGTIEVPSK